MDAGVDARPPQLQAANLSAAPDGDPPPSSSPDSPLEIDHMPVDGMDMNFNEDEPITVAVLQEPEESAVESYTVMFIPEAEDTIDEPALKIIRTEDVADADVGRRESLGRRPSSRVKHLRELGLHVNTTEAELPPGVVDVPPEEILPEIEWVPESYEHTAKVLVEKFNAVFLESGDENAVTQYAGHLIAKDHMDSNFYVCDIGCVFRLYQAWREALPRVRPFYAVKCMPDRGLVSTLAALGAGFDCATAHEIELAMQCGAGANRIIFAHPQKMPREIKAARAKGAHLTTFDTATELRKIAQHDPDAKLVLRIRADDPSAKCQLGNKYGAEEHDWEQLFATAARNGQKVVGVSFHVGSNAADTNAYARAVQQADKAFKMAAAHGFGSSMKLLDIGGGFQAKFREDGSVDMSWAEVVRDAIDEWFPPERGVKIIAEPGRFFAEAPFAIATTVYGRRVRKLPSGGQAMDYWITDGIYGSMNCLLYDHADLKPAVLKNPLEDIVKSPSGDVRPAQPVATRALYPTTLFGPTCDGADKVVEGMMMPELNEGDWVLFFKFGAYTLAGAVNFNGFQVDQDAMHVHYIFSLEPGETPQGVAAGDEV